jgi:transposase
MGRPIRPLQAEPAVTKELQRRARSATISARDRELAKIILLRLEGVGVKATAEQMNTTPKRVTLWSTRFERSGLNGLADKPGRGRNASIPETKLARIITEATRPPPGSGAFAQ